MGSGEESIISSSCFCRPSATAWMALVHSSLREAQAAERLHQPIYHHASPAAQSRNCLLINRKAISSVSSANSQWTLCECITMIKCVCLSVCLHMLEKQRGLKLLNCFLGKKISACKWFVFYCSASLRGVCSSLASPRGSPRGRCARWQWSTAGSGW